MNNTHYFQCPYCSKFETAHGKRVPKTVGKYRVKKYNDFLIFKCARCSKEFKIKYMPKLFLWSKMTNKERDAFKLKHYKGGKETNDKNI